MRLRYTKVIYSLKPAAHTLSCLQRQINIQNFIWNLGLQYIIDSFNRKEPCPNANHMYALVPKWREQYPVLREGFSQSQQYLLADLIRDCRKAYKNLEPSKFPIKRDKGSPGLFHLPQSFQVDRIAKTIDLPKIGWIKFVGDEAVPMHTKSVTVFKLKDSWEVHLVPKEAVREQLKKVRKTRRMKPLHKRFGKEPITKGSFGKLISIVDIC